MARPPRPHKPQQQPQRRQTQEDTEKVAGLPAVQALFAHAPERALRLFFDERTKAQAGEFCKSMAAQRKPYRFVSTDELTKIAGTPLHGGILAVTRPKPVPIFDAEEMKLWAKARQPLVILDGVGNPHNLGAIARTMAFFGLPRLLVSDHPGQSLPSEAAFRVAEGGLEWVEVIRVPNLAVELKRMKPFYRVVGTALGAHRPLGQVLARGDRPLAIVLGNEEDGLPPATLAACEDVATLPGSGRVQSLNVAATAAILVHMLAG
ncbi:MAG TPA: RNA methyltransferase [Magnetospirillum sp.]|nr:RNA methyltransferase [Magnetospirillum sp.]